MDVYIIFDGSPGPEGPHFIEVEDDHGRSIKSTKAEWAEYNFENQGYWRLGPFQLEEERDGGN